MELKELVGLKAAEYIKDGMTVGLGTGSDNCLEIRVDAQTGQLLGDECRIRIHYLPHQQFRSD